MKDYVVDFDLKNVGAGLKTFVSEIKKIDGVLAVYVFGSYVSGKMHRLSDVDVCVIGKISSENKMNILLGEFSDMLEVSFFRDVPIWIKIRILREGRCLFVGDESILNLVKLSVVNEYLDFKPVIDDIVKQELEANV